MIDRNYRTDWAIHKRHIDAFISECYIVPNMTDATTPVDASSTEVMASVDSAPGRSQFIIADVTCDDAWMAVRLEEASALPEWR